MWIIFQQDGAPPHWGSHVCRFLDASFPNRWIGRDGLTAWPPRSPDITPLDFFLWGYVNTLRTGSFKLFKRPFPGFLIIFNPLNAELNPICYLLALLAHHFLHVSWIRVKSFTLRLLMSYIYGAHILDVSRSHTTTQHSR